MTSNSPNNNASSDAFIKAQAEAIRVNWEMASAFVRMGNYFPWDNSQAVIASPLGDGLPLIDPRISHPV